MSTPYHQSLSKLFAAEREARRIHDDLAARGEADLSGLLAALTNGIREAKALDDDDEAEVRLVVIARLLGELEGDRVVDALIEVLDSELVEARTEAGDQLQGLAYDRFKEVALGVERAIDRLPAGSPALVELPHVLAEVPEGGVVKVLGKLLGHADADAVGAAVEVLAMIGDPAAVKLLEPLVDDPRESAFDEESGIERATVGELAQEAIAILTQEE